MAYIIYISGGERSGKSSFAQKRALENSNNPVYLATARIWDNDFAERVKHHKQERDERWTNIEEEKLLSNLKFEKQTVLLDCITLWLTNIYTDEQFDWQKSLDYAKNEWDKFISQEFTLIVVSNEIGMGVHSPNEGARKFVELQGRMNQYIAQKADEAWFMVSGLPLKVK